MKRLTVSLEDANYEYLLQQKDNLHKSLAQTINYILEGVRVSNIEFKTIAAIPGETFKVKTPPPPKPLTDEEKLERFQKKAKKIVGHELEEEEDYMLMDLQRDNIYYDKNYEKLYREGGRMKVVYIYDLPEERQEEYLRDFRDWERHENRGLNTLGIFFIIFLFTFTLPIIILSGNTQTSLFFYFIAELFVISSTGRVVYPIVFTYSYAD